MASILVAAAAIAARADTVEATALFHLDRGVAAFHRGDYVTAQREFTAAHDLVPERANPYRWLALTAAQLGDCPTARVHADAFLIRVGPDDARAAELVRLRELCHRTAATRVTAAPRRARPLYTRWWFWTGVAGAAALATTAVVLATADDPATALPPIRCDATGCRP